MNRTQLLVICMGLCGVSILSSCAPSYERNYPGSLSPQDQVAFVFQDNASTRSMKVELIRADCFTDIQTTPMKNDLTHSSLLPPPALKPNCRELIPGEYWILAWAYEKSGEHDTRKFGPYGLSFHAQPGHIYRVDAAKKRKEQKKLWFLSFDVDPYYEFNVEDVTFADEYQIHLNELERK
ncbi:MAG: hypothetical protein GY869_24795 [Planctomycetes bacterium]|nr:hypothetical protein [Planctomycetota bacterium]